MDVDDGLERDACSSQESDMLRFVPFSSALDAGFWYQLSHKKLNEYKLEDCPISICAYYSNGQARGTPPFARIDYTSFNDNIDVPPRCFPLKGTLINTNTLEEFKKKNKKEFLQLFGNKVWESMVSGEAVEDPSLLQQILCLTFADLKKYRYYYWVAFPAFLYPKSSCSKVKKIKECFSDTQISQLLAGYDGLSTVDRMYFIIHVLDDDNVRVLSLKSYDSLHAESDKVMLGFSDPSTIDLYPGWPLRNFLCLVALKWSKDRWDVLCFRDRFKDGSRSCDHSLILSIEILEQNIPTECPNTVGWEGSQGKFAPRKVDMAASMDPVRLADSAVDLNLKLMRWRLLPELDLDVIKSTRCLLLGAGTLGCNVARCLLGWGVRNITLVDNAHVSFSNPVRQTLFQFEDCLDGGKPKAQAAADALEKIFPGVNAAGKMLSIPMPGHFVSDNVTSTVESDVRELAELIESNDVVFLLMDTRESRWLPTLMGVDKQKIVINAALGFDTYLVMRHSVRGTGFEMVLPEEECWQVVGGHELGCYFCSDVVAPGNSTRDRTLDQQCTVTRPGVSHIAAALAVELMVSILQHPQRGCAPATADVKNEKYIQHSATHLGIVPHQIRGYMDKFQNMVHVSKAFDRCIACSDKVIEQYRQEGFSFLLKAFNDPSFLENLTGLTELMNSVDVDDIYELSDDESVRSLENTQ